MLHENVATAITKNYANTLTTTGVELTEGKHYWEVELLSKNMSRILIGISRPNLDPVRKCTYGCWFMHALNGTLFSHRKRGEDEAGRFEQGDRVGVLLDLGDGSVRFFRNGAQHGPGYAAGSVTGPVVAAVQMYVPNESVRLLPNAQQPE